jgi:threonine/homoserine/homoserine lactone efflux protein
VIAHLLAFIGVSLVVICTPGPDTALTVRNAMVGGRRCGAGTAAGVALGQTFWTVATAVGIAGLIHAWEPAFLALKYSGAAYLVFLGGQSLLSARRGGGHMAADKTAPRHTLTATRALRQGVISDLANPKMAAFFMSLLPQFAPEGGGALAAMLGLGLLFCAMTFSWLVLYSVVIDKAAALWRRSALRRTLDALTGGILVAFGARLAVSSRLH